MTKEEFKKLKLMASSLNEQDKLLMIQLAYDLKVPDMEFRWLFVKAFHSHSKFDDLYGEEFSEISKYWREIFSEKIPLIMEFWNGDVDSEEYEIKQREFTKICLSGGDI